MYTHTHTKPMTATEVLDRQREHANAAQAKMDERWRDSYVKAHAKGFATELDDAIFQSILDHNYIGGFGAGIYDYED